MTRPAFARDNILSDSERATSARKCLKLLDEIAVPEAEMRSKDFAFYVSQTGHARSVHYTPSEPQLQWLRDMVERYVT